MVFFLCSGCSGPLTLLPPVQGLGLVCSKKDGFSISSYQLVALNFLANCASLPGNVLFAEENSEVLRMVCPEPLVPPLGGRCTVALKKGMDLFFVQIFDKLHTVEDLRTKLIRKAVSSVILKSVALCV